MGAVSHPKGRPLAFPSWTSPSVGGPSAKEGPDYLSSPPVLNPTSGQPKPADGPQPAGSIVTYTVAPGDSVGRIAAKFGISIDTIVWANDLSGADLVGIGDELVILPVDGVLHSVEAGDTLSDIAAAYGVDAKAIVAYSANDLKNGDSITIGQKLIVPGGKVKPQPRALVAARGDERPAPAPASPPSAASAPAAATATSFLWPTYGPIFEYFSAWHEGIDISPPYGTPIYASAAGRVVDIQQWSWSYGWYVDVDHGNGYMTRYAHVSQFLVNRGDNVAQGQLIARVGSTGKSTGPHVHFEIRRNGVALNPLNFLP